MQIMQEEDDARLGMPQHHRSFVFINFYLHLFLIGSNPAPSTHLATHVHSVPENLVDYDCLLADYGDHENDAALSDSAGTAKIDINNRSAKHFISPTLYTSSSLFYRFYVWMQSPHRMHVPLPRIRYTDCLSPFPNFIIYFIYHI